ncbi:MAG: hypothetical protein NTX91_01910 [candidate division SR1 bacterium]|nr:hypothetical protein [candidate division SR1 bacterium]
MRKINIKAAKGGNQATETHNQGNQVRVRTTQFEQNIKNMIELIAGILNLPPLSIEKSLKTGGLKKLGEYKTLLLSAKDIITDDVRPAITTIKRIEKIVSPIEEMIAIMKALEPVKE